MLYATSYHNHSLYITVLGRLVGLLCSFIHIIYFHAKSGHKNGFHHSTPLFLHDEMGTCWNVWALANFINTPIILIIGLFHLRNALIENHCGCGSYSTICQGLYDTAVKIGTRCRSSSFIVS